jgi:hypothetical protein
MLIQLNAEMANSQSKLLVECTDLLDECLSLAQSLGEGQTALIWTEDGKAVDLAKVLTSKYESSVKWLTDLQDELREAKENLDKAIKDTTLLDEAQKASYQNLLYTAVGSKLSNKPIAI